MQQGRGGPSPMCSARCHHPVPTTQQKGHKEQLSSLPAQLLCFGFELVPGSEMFTRHRPEELLPSEGLSGPLPGWAATKGKLGSGWPWRTGVALVSWGLGKALSPQGEGKAWAAVRSQGPAPPSGHWSPDGGPHGALRGNPGDGDAAAGHPDNTATAREASISAVRTFRFIDPQVPVDSPESKVSWALTPGHLSLLPEEEPTFAAFGLSVRRGAIPVRSQG